MTVKERGLVSEVERKDLKKSGGFVISQNEILNKQLYSKDFIKLSTGSL